MREGGRKGEQPDTRRRCRQAGGSSSLGGATTGINHPHTNDSLCVSQPCQYFLPAGYKRGAKLFSNNNNNKEATKIIGITQNVTTDLHMKHRIIRMEVAKLKTCIQSEQVDILESTENFN